MPLLIALLLALPVSFGGVHASASPVAPTVMPQRMFPSSPSIEGYVTSYFSDIPIMARIASCESQFHQYKANGTVYRGEINHSDIGVMQINAYYQGDDARRLGLDLMTLQGNVAFGRYLYEKEGTTPWLSSSPCWNRTGGSAIAKR